MTQACDARLLLLMARRHDVSLSRMRAGIESHADRWRDRIGRDAEVIVAVRDEAAEDADPDSGNDAVLQVVGGGGDGTLTERVARLRDDLATLVDAARSTLVLGTGYVISPRRGSHLFALCGRRDPVIDMAAMHRWWLDDHAPLAMRLLDATGFGYVQIHADPARSAQAARSLGIDMCEWDMADAIEIDDVAAFVARATAPDVAAELTADEDGHIDRASLRGSFFRILPPAGIQENSGCMM